MTKNKEVTRIGGIATPCDGGCQIVLPNSWQGFRVFCIKKETDTAAGEREILVVDNILSSIPTPVLTFDSIKGEMKWNKS